MKKLAFIPAWIVAIGMANCFMVDLTNAVYSCEPTEPGDCPIGQQCSSSQKICVSNISADLAVVSAKQMVAAEGCPMGGLGFDVTASGKPKAFACPAKFANKAGQTADLLCPAPYVLCSDSSNVDLVECSRAGLSMLGFFIANAEAKKKFGGTASCGPPTSGGEYALWAGCGRTATAISCQGFTEALECSFSGSFTCSGAKLVDVTNSDGASGVLCCHP